MDNVVTEIRAILTMQAEQFKSEAERAAQSAKASFSSIANDAALMNAAVNQGISLVVSQFKWMASEVSATVSALVSTVETSMNRMFRTAKDANAFQATIDQMNGLEYAAERAGTNMSKVETVVGALEKSIGMALSAGKQGDKQRNLFAQLGLDPESLAQAGGVGALSQIAVEIGKIGNAAQRENVLAGLMSGTRGKQLASSLALFQQLRGGVDDVTAAMEHYYGVANSEEAYAKIELAKESTLKLAQVWRGMVDTLTIEVAPAIVNVQKEFDKLGLSGRQAGSAVSFAFKEVSYWLQAVVTDTTFLVSLYSSYANLAFSFGRAITSTLIAGWTSLKATLVSDFESIKGLFRSLVNTMLGDVNIFITAFNRIALATGAKTLPVFDLLGKGSSGSAAAAQKESDASFKSAAGDISTFANNLMNFSPGTMASNALKTGREFRESLFADIGSKERADQNAKDRERAGEEHDDHTDKTKHKELGLAGRLGSMQSVWALTQQHSHLDSTEKNTRSLDKLTEAIKKGSHVGGQRQGAILHP